MKDFLLDTATGDLQIKNGDLVIGESDKQHQMLLLAIEKGELKEFPATGVGLSTYLEAEDPEGLLREVRNQFIADGMTVNAVTITDNKLKVDASY